MKAKSSSRHRIFSAPTSSGTSLRHCRCANARHKWDRFPASFDSAPPGRTTCFITGHGNIPMCAQVMKAGAIIFFRNHSISRVLQVIENALIRSAEQRRRAAERNETRRLLDLLSPREFEVMQLVIRGMLNKQVGGELGVAEKTVKVHRGRLMQKLGVVSVAELVQLVQKCRDTSGTTGVRPKSNGARVRSHDN